MTAPTIRILDERLALEGEIDRYRELYFTRSLVEPGEFAFLVPFSASTAALVREQAWVLLDASGTRIGIIEETDCATYEKGTAWITARGHEAKGILGRRITLPAPGSSRIELNGPAETVMKTLVRSQCGELAAPSRRFPAFSIAPDAGRGNFSTISCAYSSLLAELCACATAANQGVRLSFQQAARTLYFDIIEGTDRSARQMATPRALFAIEYDTLSQAELIRGTQGHVSTLYVLGATTGEGRLEAPVWLDTEPQGYARIERALDAPTIDDIDALGAYGRAKLAPLTLSFFLEADLPPEGPGTIGTDFDLGDLCSVHAYGAWYTVPITSIEEHWTDKGNRMRLGFGKPTNGAFRTALGAANELANLVRAR